MVTTIRDKGGEASAYWLKFDTNGVDDPTFADGGPIDGEDIANGTFTYFASLNVNSNGVAAFGFLASDFTHSMTSSTTTPEASTTSTPEMMTSTTTTTATTGIGIITPFCNEAPPGSDCSTTDNGKVDGCCDDVRQCLPKIDGPEEKFRAKIREKLRGNGRRNQYKKANIDSGDSPSRPKNG
mmetsp:Transcript_1299/g.2396  ORF Transcript_1299/g.2396 Transcript_1299/m.2396 type:complete len:182 (+) Transcript_1299:1148-1693(+)